MSQREVAAWTEKDRQSTKKIKSLSAKLRAEQEEVRACIHNEGDCVWYACTCVDRLVTIALIVVLCGFSSSPPSLSSHCLPRPFHCLSLTLSLSLSHR